MRGLGITGVFIVYPDGFICSNDASIDIDPTINKSPGGGIKSVSKKKVLKIKSPFIHKKQPLERQAVTCLTRMTTGNVFHYDGYVSCVNENGKTEMVLTSSAQKDRVKELIEAIKEL